MKRESNYEIMKHQMQRVFAERDLAAAAEKWHLEMSDGVIRLQFIAREYNIDVKSGIVLRADNGAEAGYNEAMTLYDILSREPAVPFEKYAPISSFTRLHTTSGGNRSIFDGVRDVFDHKEAKLARACEALGGVPFGNSDVGYVLPIFNGLNVIMQFWNSDDEFGPELKLMCDQNSLSFMNYETMMFMLSHLMSRLREEME